MGLDHRGDTTLTQRLPQTLQLGPGGVEPGVRYAVHTRRKYPRLCALAFKTEQALAVEEQQVEGVECSGLRAHFFQVGLRAHVPA